MADQIVITEKSSQAKDVRAAVGSRYGDVLAAEGHLFDLLEPEDVVPAWKRWSPILLRPEGLYGTRPAEGGNKAAKLRAIAGRCAPPSGFGSPPTAIARVSSSARNFEHYEYRGQVMRVLFTAKECRPSATHRRAKPNSEYARLYAAAVARRQADRLQPVTYTHRDRHPGSGCAESHRRWPGEDADLGHRVQVRVWRSATSCRLPILKLSPPGCGRPVPDARRTAGANPQA